MSNPKSCNTCWFAGMDLRNKDGDPHGPLKNTCMVHGARITGGCRAWEEDRDAMVAPTSRDVAAARAVFRAAERQAVRA
jgi:hypothetical protein